MLVSWIVLQARPVDSFFFFSFKILFRYCLEMLGDGWRGFFRFPTSVFSSSQCCSVHTAKSPKDDLLWNNIMNNRDRHFELRLWGGRGGYWSALMQPLLFPERVTWRQGSASVAPPALQSPWHREGKTGENTEAEIQTSSHWTSRALEWLRKSLPHTLCSALIQGGTSHLGSHCW